MPPQDAEAARASEPAQFGGWQNVLAARLEELAVAISTGRPEYFVDQVRWSPSGTSRPATFRPRRCGRDSKALRRVLAEQIPAELAPMATAYIDRALAEFDGEPAGMTPRLTAKTPEGRLAAEYLLAILEGDRQQASRLILEAADQGQSVPTSICRCFSPPRRNWDACGFWARSTLPRSTSPRPPPGWSWPNSTPGPAASQPTARRWSPRPLPATSMTWVSRWWPTLFEMDGWRVIQLGANMPVEDLAQAAEFYQPDVVALSVSLATQLPALKEAVAAVRASERGAAVKILVGGCGMSLLSKLATCLVVDGVASNATEAVARGHALVGLPARAT